MGGRCIDLTPTGGGPDDRSAQAHTEGVSRTPDLGFPRALGRELSGSTELPGVEHALFQISSD